MNTSHDELNGTVIHIDAAGSGDFRTLGEGLAWLESRQDTPEAGGAPDSWTTFSIAPGTYREKVFVDLPRVRFRGTGAGPESVRIVWADHARMTLPDGRPIRTFNSFTLFVGGDHFRAENLTVANDAGSGDQVGQAVAAYVDADDVLFRNCQLLGHQDTLFTGPLPPAPIEGKDFGGPRDSGPFRLAPKRAGSPAVGRQRYEGCLIAGDIDFIFGSAEALFRDCEIRSLYQDKPVNGWISAASSPFWSASTADGTALADDGSAWSWLRPDEAAALRKIANATGRRLDRIGHCFYRCRLSGEPGLAPGSVYLGRPWRDHARSLFIACELGPHIHAAGWDDWKKPQAHDTVTYVEAGCHGPGLPADAKSRVDWAFHLPAAID